MAKKNARVTHYEPGADGGLDRTDVSSADELGAVGDNGGEPMLGVEGEDGEREMAPKDPPRDAPGSLDDWAQQVEEIQAELDAQVEKRKKIAGKLKEAAAKERELRLELANAIHGRRQLRLQWDGGPRPDPDDAGTEPGETTAPASFSRPTSSAKTAGKRSSVFGRGRRPEGGA